MAGMESARIQNITSPGHARLTNGHADDSASPTSEKAVKVIVNDDKAKPAAVDRQKAATTPPPENKQPKFKQHKTLFPIPRSRDKTQGTSTSGLGAPEQLDITKSKWISRSDDRDREVVTLDIRSQHAPEGTRRSFRWVHHHRHTLPVSFAEFQQHVRGISGLYEEELAVATKCLEDVRNLRKISARGRFFDHTVHKSERDHRVGEQQVPVRATFISIPIFALLNAETESASAPVYPASKDIRGSDLHPVRSLLQYSNILAIDDERDLSQVVRKINKAAGASRRFVQVPELWALVVNMFTLITCAPFSVDDLCGKNIERQSPDIKPGQSPVSKDTRTIVKYTDRKGRLVDLECRQWHSLIDYISCIESEKDPVREIELAQMLRQSDSEYKIVDLRFQVVDSTRWIDIVDSQYDHTEFVHLRVVRLGKGDVLSLKFAQRQHQTFQIRTLVLTASRLYLEVLKQRLIQRHRSRAPTKEIDDMKSRITKLRKRIVVLHRSRLLSRFMLYAARYHLMIPDRTGPGLNHGPEASTTSKPWVRKQRKTSGPRHYSFGRHSPEHSRASSPTDSHSTRNPRSSDPSELHVSMSSPRQPVPDIVVQDGSVGSSSPTTYRPRSLSSHFVGRGQVSVANLGLPPSRDTVVATDPYLDIDLEAQDPLLSDSRTHHLRGSSATVFGQQLHGEPYLDLFATPDTRHTSASRPLETPRRHSTSSGASSEITLFDASPLRRPLVAEGDAALRVPARPINVPFRPAPRRQKTMTDLPSTNIVHTRRPPIPSTESRQSEEVEKESGISAQASDRISGAIGRLVPFFERQAGRIERQPGFDATTKTTDLRRITSAPAVGGSGEADVVEGGVMSIIALVDDQMSKGAPFPPQEFPITAKDYEETPSSSASDLMWRLQADRTALEAGQSKNQPSPEAGAEFSFQEVKEELFLSVYGMLRCFINVKTHKSRLIAKVWGMVFDICCMSVKESERQTYPNRHEIKYVVAAKDEIEKLELVCSDLLKGIRPDSGDDDGAIRYNMPTPLIQAFESIVLYLLCIWRASRRYGVESSHLTQVQDQFYEHLREAEAAFIRMRVHAEADDDRFAGFESLRTADTLLALLVENALDISDSSVVEDRPDAPHFDLRHVYSKYTSECIVKAKRHASARIHKDVKLLIEEIATVGEILEQQRSIVNDLFSIKKRESPMQALDQRVKRRTLAHLDETARHFKKLYEHARQAADWNQHFINVRGEDNNKAIYVFTAVTVIFLPLTFVAGLLGMNTKEIRDTKDSQWLFWAVAMPFTACVLVICIGIVQYKFLVRKRLNAVLRRCCGSRRRR